MDPDAIHCNIDKKEQQTNLLFYTKRSHNTSSKTDKNTLSEKKKKWILTHVASESICFVETFNLIVSNINEFVLMPLHYWYIIKYLSNSTKLHLMNNKI